MTQKMNIAGLRCKVAPCPGSTQVAYMLYPMDLPSEWMLRAARQYKSNIVAISGMDWDNDLTPWPSAGVPSGEPPFKGEADSFLELLRRQVVPRVETALGLRKDEQASAGGAMSMDMPGRLDDDVDEQPADPVRRTLVGVSLSGLFALWQWMKCDLFQNVGCLSGSFWYKGFADWMASRKIPSGKGEAYFLLGEREGRTRVKVFRSIAAETERIVKRLKSCGIRTISRIVPGDHYSSPIPRLESALSSLLQPQQAAVAR